ncbi:hypothetical protein L1887_40465 [Cichorium endivia]|nr:hypothetical protein L1887_40465 [Cichorium endivia]
MDHARCCVIFYEASRRSLVSSSDAKQPNCESSAAFCYMYACLRPSTRDPLDALVEWLTRVRKMKAYKGMLLTWYVRSAPFPNQAKSSADSSGCLQRRGGEAVDPVTRRTQSLHHHGPRRYASPHLARKNRLAKIRTRTRSKFQLYTAVKVWKD